MTTNLQEAVLSAAAEANNSTGWRLLQGLGPMVAVLNLPLAIVLSLSGAAGEAYSSHKDLSEAKMPDDWLGQVASSPEISQEGLAFLARRLAEKGAVSVRDAVDWLGIEEEQAKKKREESEKQLPGAQALLARAEKDCGKLLEPDLIDRATSALKAVAQYAPGMLSAVSSVLKGGRSA